MLDAVGVSSVDALFAHVPARLRERARLDLPAGLSEPDLRARLGALAARNLDADATPVFAGGGVYPHASPAVVDHVLQRSEFATAYTPYQAEVSQGTLQAIFEFQTFVALLMGMEVANASMYDGASATAEAVLMARRALPGRRIVWIARALHPHYREVVRTYVQALGDVEVRELPWGADGRTAAARRPGASDVDVAVAEGQSVGLGVSYGGPGVGLFATRDRLVRTRPGRVVGETVDASGRRGYVLTLATREQHIRRERATSNICTNQGLCSLA